MTRLLVLLLPLLAAVLSSCAMTPGSTKRAYCNMLKSDLVFNGQTSITRNANIQNSDTPMDQRSYDAADCEDDS